LGEVEAHLSAMTSFNVADCKLFSASLKSHRDSKLECLVVRSRLAQAARNYCLSETHLGFDEAGTPGTPGECPVAS
jgi:hypothetical protein